MFGSREEALPQVLQRQQQLARCMRAPQAPAPHGGGSNGLAARKARGPSSPSHRLPTAQELVVFLEAPVADAGVRFLQLSPGEFFFTTLKVGVCLALTLCRARCV